LSLEITSGRPLDKSDRVRPHLLGILQIRRYKRAHEDAHRRSLTPLSWSLIALAFAAGVIVAALCFVGRASIAALLATPSSLPIACVAGAAIVRGFEAIALAISAKAQRNLCPSGGR
jgi:hypothetical protein